MIFNYTAKVIDPLSTPTAARVRGHGNGSIGYGPTSCRDCNDGGVPRLGSACETGARKTCAAPSSWRQVEACSVASGEYGGGPMVAGQVCLDLK